MSEIEKLAMRISHGILGMPWTKSLLLDRASKDIEIVVTRELQKFFAKQQARQDEAKKMISK